jgi:hypothetical protein
MKRFSNLFGRALRETGQALDRVGLNVQENEIFHDTFARHRPVMNLLDKVSLKVAKSYLIFCRKILFI